VHGVVKGDDAVGAALEEQVFCKEAHYRKKTLEGIDEC
jgi:hypothetical protein